jgi:hypothetical protein
MPHALLAAALAVVALGAGCNSLECSVGTHAENGECMADVPECTCGPGTVQVANDLGCECVVAPTRLPGARVCGCLQRPGYFCNIGMPGPCEVESDVPNFVMATADEGVGGISLVGGHGVPAMVDGGLTEIHGLEKPFRLDGQPARVLVVVDADGNFTTDPGAQVFEWEVEALPSQPRLPLRGVSVTGVLDAAGRLSQGGHIVGCYTPESAAAIYLEVLSQTLLELCESSGEALDCDATGSGAVDGYTFDLKWWPGPAVDVFE